MALNLPHSFTSSPRRQIDRLTIQSVLREASPIAMLSRKEISSNYGAPKLSSVATWLEMAEWTMFCAREMKTFRDGTTTMLQVVKFYATIKKFVHELMGCIPFLRTIVAPNIIHWLYNYITTLICHLNNKLLEYHHPHFSNVFIILVIHVSERIAQSWKIFSVGNTSNWNGIIIATSVCTPGQVWAWVSLPNIHITRKLEVNIKINIHY